MHGWYEFSGSTGYGYEQLHSYIKLLLFILILHRDTLFLLTVVADRAEPGVVPGMHRHQWDETFVGASLLKRPRSKSLVVAQPTRRCRSPLASIRAVGFGT